MKHKNECSAARPESLNNISFLTSWLTFFVFWIFFVTTFYLFLPVNPSFSSRTFSGGLTNGHRIQIISPGYYTCSILLSFRMFENLTLKKWHSSLHLWNSLLNLLCSRPAPFISKQLCWKLRMISVSCGRLNRDKGGTTSCSVHTERRTPGGGLFPLITGTRLSFFQQSF